MECSKYFQKCFQCQICFSLILSVPILGAWSPNQRIGHLGLKRVEITCFRVYKSCEFTVLDFYTDFLSTLPKEEIYSAFGEILKYAIGFKSDVFDLLKNQSVKEIINNTELLTKLIQSCAITKYGIVVADEK